MKRPIKYLVAGIICFYLDIILTMMSPIQLFNLDFVLVPRLTFMFLMLLAFYRNLYTAVILAVILGLMTDVYFGQIYGVYLMAYVVCILVVDKFFNIFYRDHGVVFMLILLGIVGLDLIVTTIYGMLGMIQFDIIQFIVFRTLPTLLLNLVILAIIYVVLDFRQNRKSRIDMKIK